jgi:hypothetical protein
VKTFEKAVTGFNHNIKHRDKVYHVQTEDSGLSNPHIITHVFVGGNILATKKSGYGHLVGNAAVAQLVKDLMQEQHKAMLRNLVAGAYDNLGAAAAHYQPGQLAEVQPVETPKPAPPPAPAPRPPLQAPVSVRISSDVPRRIVPLPLTRVVSTSPPVVPAEVLAARALPEAPKENNSGVETLFGEDLISEKSLDEVILSYLADHKG